MAIVVTDIGNAGNSTGQATVTLTNVSVPSGAAICVIICEFTNNAASGTLGDGTNTYTSISRGAPNNALSSNGFGNTYVASNVTALSGGTITYTKKTSGNAAAISAFYATGVATAPVDSTVTALTTGSSTAPSVTSAAVPAVSGELIVGSVFWSGGTSDTFTQDSTHAAYAAPFSFNKTTAHAEIAGGNFVQNTAASITYAPTIPNDAWVAFIMGLKPGATAPTPEFFDNYISTEQWQAVGY